MSQGGRNGDRLAIEDGSGLAGIEAVLGFEVVGLVGSFDDKDGQKKDDKTNDPDFLHSLV